MNCYIFDIDGTIADNSHRQHFVQQEKKDWKAYNALMAHDTPHWQVIHVARALDLGAHPIVICTGREEVYEEITREWLEIHAVPYQHLLMRGEKDYRPDEIVKVEMLAHILNVLKLKPAMAFDDRDKVVAMWRANGVPCAQVAEGNF